MVVLFVYLLYFGVVIVVQQYLVIAVSFFSHHCGAYLAKAYAVAPSGSGEFECLRNAVSDVFLVHNESAAVKMCVAERASYLKFLSDGESMF